jgi:hypothetical protein
MFFNEILYPMKYIKSSALWHLCREGAEAAKMAATD